jgi:hypothetical protein
MSLDTKPTAIITCFYRRIPNFKFDLDYYLTSHIPLTNKLWNPHGLLHTTILEVLPDSEYAFKIVMEWKDTDAWEKALEDEQSKQLVDDVKSFTNSEPIFVVGRTVGQG